MVPQVAKPMILLLCISGPYTPNTIGASNNNLLDCKVNFPLVIVPLPIPTSEVIKISLFCTKTSSSRLAAESNMVEPD